MGRVKDAQRVSFAPVAGPRGAAQRRGGGTPSITVGAGAAPLFSISPADIEKTTLSARLALPSVDGKLTDDCKPLQVVGDRREGRGEVGADSAQHGDRRDRDQGGNETVLDRRGTIRVSQKIDQSRKYNPPQS
jgi:hypothetical protein